MDIYKIKESVHKGFSSGLVIYVHLGSIVREEMLGKLTERHIAAKNLGRLWLDYIELQGDFYMLQLMSFDSGQKSAYGGPIYTK